jgi:hypothetical protein
VGKARLAPDEADPVLATLAALMVRALDSAPGREPAWVGTADGLAKRLARGIVASLRSARGLRPQIGGSGCVS